MYKTIKWLVVKDNVVLVPTNEHCKIARSKSSLRQVSDVVALSPSSLRDRPFQFMPWEERRHCPRQRRCKSEAVAATPTTCMPTTMTSTSMPIVEQDIVEAITSRVNQVEHSGWRGGGKGPYSKGFRDREQCWFLMTAILLVILSNPNMLILFLWGIKSKIEEIKDQVGRRGVHFFYKRQDF